MKKMSTHRNKLLQYIKVHRQGTCKYHPMFRNFNIDYTFLTNKK